MLIGFIRNIFLILFSQDGKSAYAVTRALQSSPRDPSVCIDRGTDIPFLDLIKYLSSVMDSLSPYLTSSPVMGFRKRDEEGETD